MGISRGQFIKLERGERQLTERTIALAAKAFGVSKGEIVDERGKLPPGTPHDIEVRNSGRAIGTLEAKGHAPNTDLTQAEDIPNFRPFGGARDVPEYGAAAGGKRGDADFQFNGQTVDMAPRPPGIANKKDVYALRVTGDSMSPKYEEGERIYVDPHRSPAIMDYVVIELKPSEDGEPGDGFIKRLVRRTPTKYVVSQFNPPKELEFERDEVKSLHRVIPTDELLGI